VLYQCFLSRAGEIDAAVAPQASTRPSYSPVFRFLVLCFRLPHADLA